MSNYRIIVCGVMPGRTVDEVVEALTRVSSKPPATLRALLDGRRVVVKRTMEVSKAAQYKRTLTKMGCVCTIEAEGSVPRDSSGPALTVNFTTPVDTRGHQPDSVREYQYAKRPTMGLSQMLGYVGLGGWFLVALLLFVFYYGYQTFVGNGWAVW